MTKFLLDSGDPKEYKEIQDLARRNKSEIWGATTNPTLIAKKLAGKKITQSKAFELQKKIVLEIVSILPGAVSAEVYANEKTKAREMIKQGREISKWHKRVVVKLPTSIEGFKARSALRQENIPVNNTLVFSQEQVFAICLHEKIIQNTTGPTTDLFPPFISPFVGRLDDIGIDGMMLIENSMKIKKEFNIAIWMLEASVRQVEHIKRGLQTGTELITCPSKPYNEWFSLSKKELENLNPVSYAKEFKAIDYWNPPKNLLEIDSIKKFMQALESGKLNIHHPLTEKGITRFADDWKAIISE
ncbi:MAG: transaldolase family protein [Candidatus Levybacteria bacterium]|nr:transaldolase family protein [Candidatus Levybacteria bacterium]